ncbi:MAG: Hpt domain-containing protein [Acidobacteriota bacterium]|nr:Hpt domain-containing protein [Acidobacteriota bacterium]
MSEVVDITRIQETSDGDIEFEIELIEMYLDDARDHIGQIGAHVDNANASGLKQSAHTLKGSSANIGAVGMQKVAFDLERAGAENNMSVAPDHHNRLKEVFEATDVFFRDYLAEMT